MKENFIVRKNNLSNRFLLTSILSFLLVGLFLTDARAAAGDLDATFGGGGRVTTNFYELEAATAVAIQPDGKIVVAGTSSDSSFIGTYFALARYNADGTPDMTFGNGGQVTTDVLNNTLTVDLALQPDGKIVVAGAVWGASNTRDFGIARYNPDGTPDITFGLSGLITVDFFGDADGATAVAVQPDGKLVVGGRAVDGAGNPSDFAALRLEPNGALDAGFGTGGKTSVDFSGGPDRVDDLALQPDGKIVLAGSANLADIGVLRLDAGGTPDALFGAGGKVTTDFAGTQDFANAVAVQADGKLVVAGGVDIGGLNGDFGFVRYHADGTPDASFGTGGKVRTDFLGQTDVVNDIVIQPDGRIVAVGLVYIIGADIDFGVARYNPDGTPDAGFGIGGKVTTPFFDSEAAEGVALQADCKIVAAGFSTPSNTSDSLFAVARYDGGTCSGVPPTPPCPKKHGYWKNNPNAWPVDSLILGNKTYTKTELLALLGDPSKTDASIILARQLIAAKLNLASGAEAAPIAATITHADGVLSNLPGKLPAKIKPSSAPGQQMTADAGVLDNYNSGLLTPGCTP